MIVQARIIEDRWSGTWRARGSLSLKVGDVVVVRVLSAKRFATVTAVGRTRKAAGSSYRGTLKPVLRKATAPEVRQVVRTEVAREHVQTAMQTAHAERRRMSAMLK